MPNIAIPKVLFVLGAGSSSALGFPLGAQLKDLLLTQLTRGNAVFNALVKSGFGPEQVQGFTQELQTAEFDTLDEHIRQIGNVLTRTMGKRAISYLIRSWENQDALLHRNNQVRHWYKLLVNHLAQHPEQLSPDQFSFITFNYDRSLPHYLFNVLSSRHLPLAKVLAFAGPSNFFHVHGNIGELPWQLEQGGDSKSYYQYGAILSEADLGSHLPEILLPDDKRDNGLFMGRLAMNAQIVAFVGFGFHEANIHQLPFDRHVLTEGVKNRRFFSINPDAPPSDLRLEGQSIRHIPGPAETVMEEFLRNLANGKLVLDAAPEGRFIKRGDISQTPG